MNPDAKELHEGVIIIDAVCPLLSDMSKIDEYKAGGLTAVAPTVGAWDDSKSALRNIGAWYKMIRDRDDLMLIKTAADIRTAKESGKTGIILHFQGTGPIEDSLEMVDSFRALGVGVMQLAYNIKNRVGDGCEERTDSGLSRFGVQVIERMNKVKMIVDCSHTGHQTTYDAIEYSAAPVIISHANARKVYDSPRNLPDELIKAIGDNGGTIGLVGFPGFVSGDKRPSIDQFIDHMVYMADMIGIDRVTLGIDYYGGQDPYVDIAAATAAYEARLADNTWSPKAYPPPPHYYPSGIETPATMSALTEAMLRRDFTEDEIRKIYGENLIRMYETVWGG